MDVNQLEWEDISCACCGSQNSELLFQGPDRLEGLPGNFTMVRCKQCGVFRQSPRLKWLSLKKYYPQDYASYTYPSDTSKTTWKDKFKQYGNWKRRRAIERYQAGGRLLEVGCGTGGFLEELIRSRKWEVVGIEPNETAASYVKRKLGVPIYQGRFSEVELAPESFDAIVLWCVLEHMEQPVDDLRLAFRLLKKGGWLVFSIPNYESLEARIFGQYWAGWDLPRHLYIFPRPILHRILETLDFKIVDERCLSTGYAILGHSINFWTQSWAHKYPRLRHYTLRAYHSWITRVALALPLKIMDQLKLTTTLTIFAQKIS